MHPAIWIFANFATRIAAFLIGAVAFYLAFFVYEDEEGRWLNRLEIFWLGIYERAKTTNSTSVALFNNLGDALRRFFDKLFGRRFISLRSAVVSTNFSAGSSMCVFLLLINQLYDKEGSVFYLSFYLVPMAFILFGILPIWLNYRWALILTSVPAFLVLLAAILFDSRLGAALPRATTVSLVCDYLALVLIRRLFRSLATAPSFVRIIAMIMVLGFFVILIIGLPFVYYGKTAILSGLLLASMNLSTAVYCMVPLAMLVLVLLHRIVWPFLSRLMYPVVRFRLLGNRKALVAIGSMCVLFALNAQRIGVREILKLFT